MQNPKKMLGFKPKPKTLEEVNQEYANHAAQVGHKAMLVSNTEKLISKTQAEIENHLLNMNDLAQLGQRLKAKEGAPAEAEVIPPEETIPTEDLTADFIPPATEEVAS